MFVTSSSIKCVTLPLPQKTQCLSFIFKRYLVFCVVLNVIGTYSYKARFGNNIFRILNWYVSILWLSYFTTFPNSTYEALLLGKSNVLTYPKNTHFLFNRKYHCMLTSCLTGLNSAALLMFNQQQIQTSQTGGQLYIDASLYKVSECSLTYLYKWPAVGESCPSRHFQSWRRLCCLIDIEMLGKMLQEICKTIKIFKFIKFTQSY